MKKNHIMAIILTINFVGCSPDSENPERQKSNSQSLRHGDAFPSNPANPANPYDIAGRLHNEIAEAYFLAEHDNLTTQSIINEVEVLANQNEDFIALKKDNYTLLLNERAEAMLHYPYDCLTELTTDNKLSIEGQYNLRDFISALMMFQYAKMDENIAYQHIVNYEASILSGELSIQDQKIILTTSSIARYAYSFAKRHKRKPRDRDWDLMVGNIVAGIETENIDVTNAIRMSVVVGLAGNFQE